MLIERSDGNAASSTESRSEVSCLRLLAGVLESFTSTIDLEQVLRRIVEITREQFQADRAWLLFPANLEADFATVSFEATSAAYPGAFARNVRIPLGPSRALIKRAIEGKTPVAVYENDPAVDPEMWRAFQIRSQLLQIVEIRGGDRWAFGLHQCSHSRHWTEEEIDVFAEIGRYATLAIANAQLYRSSVSEAAKVSAILDQIPQAAAIYDANGLLERMNEVAMRRPSLFDVGAQQRLLENRHRYLDGRALTVAELPTMRALRGETVRGDYIVFDHRIGEDRIVNLNAAPIRNDTGAIIGVLLLCVDVTEERQKQEREIVRRRHSECLANIGLDLVPAQLDVENFDRAAARIAQAIEGNVAIYLYRSIVDGLELVGASYSTAAGETFRRYIESHPYRPGEGLPGTVFQIGRPLLFSEIRGTAVVEYGRDEEERALKAALGELSLIAYPIESFGERVGAILLSLSEMHFQAEDLDFAHSVAERIGGVAHIRRLTQVSQEGHRAAEELARREVDARARLEAVLESAPIGIAVVSADELRFEAANARWHEFMDRTGRGVSDNKIIDLRVSDILPRFDRDLKEVAEAGETRIRDAVEFQRGIYFNVIISPVRGRLSGITQSLTILVQDVSDQVRYKKEIEALAQLMEERSARLDSILSSMTDGLWVYDAAGNVIDVNSSALGMFGLGSRSEAAARGSFRDFQLRYPDGRAIPDEDLPFARALRGEVVPDYLAVAKHLITGRDLDVSIAAAPIESTGVMGAVLVIRDVTALQELDRKKDEFLSVASHELRTPLTTIKGYTQLLSSSVPSIAEEDRAMYLRAVLGEIERMMGLISELLDVSRIETNRLQIHRQPVRWIDFLRKQTESLQIRNPKRRVTFRSHAVEVSIEIDTDRMRQVVDNLLSNALKYSGEDTPIEVEVTTDQKSLFTSVIDHGIGIPTDEISQLFERFHRARNVSSRYYGGLGLGLYIARAIIEAHEGSIAVESVEGEGSRFTITLPLPTHALGERY